MGVAGSGKSTIGRALAAALGWQFFDGDDFHSEANKQKMAHGVALDDRDRQGWLERLRGLIAEQIGAGKSAVLACSALKRSYRETLCVSGAEVKLVYLKGSHALLKERLLHRKDHFFSPPLLEDQLARLEEPAAAITVEIARPPAEIVADLQARLAAFLK
jgi:gluconokinase